MATDQDSGESSETTTAAPKGKKLLDRAWEALWGAGFEEAAARRYRTWMLNYIVFHGKRHPREMGVPEVWAFLADERFCRAGAPARRTSGRRRARGSDAEARTRSIATASVRPVYGYAVRAKCFQVPPAGGATVPDAASRTRGRSTASVPAGQAEN